jgi:hypothetical protein
MQAFEMAISRRGFLPRSYIDVYMLLVVSFCHVNIITLHL